MEEIDKMAEAIKTGIDNNGTDAPVMSMDPKTQQVSVVGDPNKVYAKNEPYSIDFIYPADQLTEEDKHRMKANPEDDNEYIATVKYPNIRIKPLYRTSVAMSVAEILTKMNVMMDDGGYNTDGLGRRAVKVFLDNIDTIARIAQQTLDIPEQQMQFISPTSLVDFFLSMLNNEPNIIKEAGSFLEPSLIKQLLEMISPKNETESQASTQQN